MHVSMCSSRQWAWQAFTHPSTIRQCTDKRIIIAWVEVLAFKHAHLFRECVGRKNTHHCREPAAGHAGCGPNNMLQPSEAYLAKGARAV